MPHVDRRPVEPAWARAELVRRYLHCYGPSTPQHFAEWAGIGPAQAGRAWDGGAVRPGLCTCAGGNRSRGGVAGALEG